MQFDNFVEKFFKENDEDNMGFNDIIIERQKKIEKIKERLKGYYLSDTEIECLINLLVESEIKIEEYKKQYNFKNYTPDSLCDFQHEVIKMQEQMKEDFDKALVEILNEKYTKAKEIVEQIKKENPFG